MSLEFSKQILIKQYQECQKSEIFSPGLPDENNFYRWRISFIGPPDTLYEGGYFTAFLTFPTNYPQSPPEMRFETEMWHPNIFKDGKVCISILHNPGVDQFNEQEKAEERWRPVLGVEQIMLSVISMLSDPNCDSPANVDAAVQMKKDPEGYKEKVKKLVMKSMDSM